jgi:hypothetical protein
MTRVYREPLVGFEPTTARRTIAIRGACSLDAPGKVARKPAPCQAGFARMGVPNRNEVAIRAARRRAAVQ